MKTNYRKHAKTILSLLIIVLISFTGCKSTKDVNRNKEDRQLTETTKIITKRIGDTVRYEVPKIILKDTVITIKNYKTGTTQILRYGNDGKLTSAECLSGVIEVIQENNRILIENINSMNKQKETEIPASTILYGFIGLAVFVVIVMFVFMKYIKSILPI